MEVDLRKLKKRAIVLKNKAKYNLKRNIWRYNNLEHSRALQLSYKKKKKDKVNAQSCIYRALKKNKIFKLPCELCGESKVEAHHEDYKHPLIVIWLCRQCHSKIHTFYKRVIRLKNEIAAINQTEEKK